MTGSTQRDRYALRRGVALVVGLLVHLGPGPAGAQAASPAHADEGKNAQQIMELKQEVRELRELVLRLQSTIAEQRSAAAAGPPSTPPPAPGLPPTPTPGSTAPTQVGSEKAPSIPGAASVAAPASAASVSASGAGSAGIVADSLHGMTVNALLDAYYEYNLNEPVGRVNYLRAYDVSSNNFSLNQADLMIESAPDVASGKRVGMRVDLQFGQATETLQGSSANELRPEIYRNIFQAYGSYWVPIDGSVLTLDVGKWASSLGIEGNYTKDQMNYSRSFWFNFLPFYHAGLRANLKVDDQVSFNYWVVNGTDQTEAFNNYKDQMIGFVLTPVSTLSWTFNYYLGMEHPDIVYVTNPSPGQVGLPTQQGMAFMPIANAPNGRLRIADTYLTWQATSGLALSIEGDYVTEQLYSYSPVGRATGGAFYARYQVTPRLALAARGEYVADPDGLYSGSRQYLSDTTLTAQYKLEDSFLVYGEWRRDGSNHPYFLTSTFQDLASHQSTLGLGFIWWIGQKQGAW